MAKLSLDVPEDVHLRVRRLQLDEEIAGKKINLRDLYNELIELGLEAKEKAAQK